MPPVSTVFTNLLVAMILVLFYYYLRSLGFEDYGFWKKQPSVKIDLDLYEQSKKGEKYPKANLSRVDPEKFKEAQALFEMAQSLIEKDPQLARDLLKQSARLGDPRGYYTLGEIYMFGDDQLEIHNCLAEYYFRRGSSLGHPESHTRLAFLLSTGKCQQKPDQILALLHLRLADAGGDLTAKMKLGYMYKEGIGVEKSCKKSLALYSRVAKNIYGEMEDKEIKKISKFENIQRIINVDTKSKNAVNEKEKIFNYYQMLFTQGNVKSLNKMGEIYQHGYRGIPKNYKMAIEYFKRAIKFGNNEAKSNLGFMNLFGKGCERNVTKARLLFKEAVKVNITVAKNYLGLIYLNGYGVEVNQTRAYDLFQSASEEGLPEAQYNLAKMLHFGMGIKNNSKLAFEYMKRAAKGLHIGALYKLGKMYRDGIGTDKSCERAVKSYKIVAEEGHWKNSLNQAFELWQNRETIKALIIYEQLANLGYEIAQSNVGTFYQKIIDTKQMKIILNGNLKLIGRQYQNQTRKNIKDWLEFQRLNRAVTYFYLSGNQNYSENLNILGDCYLNGNGIEKSIEKAFYFYKKASELGSARGCFNLGRFYESGLGGTKKDFVLAKEWYDKALQIEPYSYYAMGMVFTKWGFNFFLNSPRLAIKQLQISRLNFPKHITFTKIVKITLQKFFPKIIQNEIFDWDSIDFEMIVLFTSTFCLNILFLIRYIIVNMRT
ncbi:sel-1-like protein [Anaeramoeba flamelloides]|uniref:Sel-1-like protein n=1 Tax=Anaeramoeba flamelloides TaxID=1746091 RepID=A0ABQ8Z5J2_9EUKA|nr:sel-1-like protein [Anaeramoeba flamelloides]